MQHVILSAREHPNDGVREIYQISPNSQFFTIFNVFYVKNVSFALFIRKVPLSLPQKLTFSNKTPIHCRKWIGVICSFSFYFNFAYL